MCSFGVQGGRSIDMRTSVCSDDMYCETMNMCEVCAPNSSTMQTKWPSNLSVVNAPGNFISANKPRSTLATHHALRANLAIVAELLDRSGDNINNVLVADVGIVEAVFRSDTKSTGSVLDELVLTDCYSPCTTT